MKSDFDNFKERTGNGFKDFFNRNLDKIRNTTMDEMKDRMFN